MPTRNVTIALITLILLPLVAIGVQSADSLIAPWVVHILGDVAMMGIAVTLLWDELLG